MSPQVGFVYLPCYDGGRTALRGRVTAACAAFARRTGRPPTVVLVPPGTPPAGLPGIPVTILADATVRAGELWPGAPDPPASDVPGALDGTGSRLLSAPDQADPDVPPSPLSQAGRESDTGTSHRHRRTAA